MLLTLRLVGALTWLAVAFLPALPSAGRMSTADRNGDRRPDLWRVYDGEGRVARVAIDTNLDGHADVEEYYAAGVLARREVDRNLDGRTDAIDEFDPATGEEVASVRDVDFDGVSDLLVLFRDGQSVFRRWAPRPTPTAAPPVPSSRVDSTADADRLAPLSNPFAQEPAIRALARLDSAAAGVHGPKLAVAATTLVFASVAAPSDGRISCGRPATCVRLRSSRGPPAALHS